MRPMGQRGFARRRAYADLERSGSDGGGIRGLGQAHFPRHPARTPRRSRGSCEDGAVPRLRRCIERARRGDLCRRRSDGVACGRADLSRLVGTSRKSWIDQHDLTKGRIAVVLIGSLTQETYFPILRRRVEPSSLWARHFHGRGFDHPRTGEPVMSNAAHIFAPIPASRVPSEKSDDSPLNPILLFGGIGLLVFLIAILTGVQGAWY